MLGPRLPLAEAHERFDLRRYQVPPFDPLAVPSPLVQVKASLKDERRDDVVFVVSGDTPIDRWPVAVISDYDGVVWTVADPDRDPDAAEFVPVDTQLPELDDPLPEGTTTVEHTVEIRDLGGYVPARRRHARRLTLAGDPDPRMNMRHRHRRPPRRRPRRLTYESRSAVVPDRHRGRSWRRRRSTPVDRTEELELLPPPVRNLAADLVEGRDRGLDRMAAIRDEFVDQGFYDVTEDTAPGPLLRPDRRHARGPRPDRRLRGAVRRRCGRDGPGRRAAGPRRRRLPDPAHRLAARAGRGDGQRHLGVGRDRRRRAGWIPVDVTPGPLPDPRSRQPGQHDRAGRHPQPAATASPAAADRAPRQQEDEIESDDEVEPSATTSAPAPDSRRGR